MKCCLSLLNCMPSVPGLHTFTSSRLTRLTCLFAFAPYMPSCITYFRGLRALIFTRLFGYAAYYKRAFKCDEAFYSRQYENVLKRNKKQWSFISCSFNFLKISYFKGSVSIIIIFIIIIVVINLFQFCLKNCAKW